MSATVKFVDTERKSIKEFIISFVNSIKSFQEFSNRLSEFIDEILLINPKCNLNEYYIDYKAEFIKFRIGIDKKEYVLKYTKNHYEFKELA